MDKWFQLSENDRKEILTQTASRVNLNSAAVEKDLWVTIALRAIFSSKYSNEIVFKGGTSLSKCWGIIDRFSEDIDLGINRDFFGFSGDLKRKQVTKLRKASCTFVTDVFMPELETQLKQQGAKDFEMSFLEFERSDTDPVAIEIRYTSLTDDIEYIKPRILIELSSRSLREPFEYRDVRSLIGSQFPEKEFSDKAVAIPTVLPSRTLIEKMFLLHEEFQKPEGRKVRSERMTRHLYDISRIMDTPFLEMALQDKKLYNTIIVHREMITNVSWIDYSKHAHNAVNFIPPNKLMKEWQRDYQNMKESMFYGETETFEDLIDKLRELNLRLNKI